MPKTQNSTPKHRGHDPRLLGYCMYEDFVDINTFVKKSNYVQDPNLMDGEVCSCIEKNNKKKKAHQAYIRKKMNMQKESKAPVQSHRSKNHFDTCAIDEYCSNAIDNLRDDNVIGNVIDGIVDNVAGNAIDNVDHEAIDDLRHNFDDDVFDDPYDDNNETDYDDISMEVDSDNLEQQQGYLTYPDPPFPQKKSKSNATTESWNNNKDLYRDLYLESMTEGIMEKPTSTTTRKLKEIVQHGAGCNGHINSKGIIVYYQHAHKIEKIEYCHCRNLVTTMMHMQIMPSSPERQVVGVSFSLLREIKLMQMINKVSIHGMATYLNKSNWIPEGGFIPISKAVLSRSYYIYSRLEEYAEEFICKQFEVVAILPTECIA
ncbi:hypothetical protein BD770DRAFT_409992 [Pilaira anomala]|nr:hypothetical protein BD770DRAFT_409992 [Pilaira anomala]